MKCLGIDYGTSRIGIALSDEHGTLAFPKEVIENNSDALARIASIADMESVELIVVGESVDQCGNPNEVMKHIRDFVRTLQPIIDIPITLEQEMFTSLEASRQDITRPTARKPKSKIIKKDDSAAALILQRYLDKQGA